MTTRHVSGQWARAWAWACAYCRPTSLLSPLSADNFDNSNLNGGREATEDTRIAFCEARSESMAKGSRANKHFSRAELASPWPWKLGRAVAVVAAEWCERRNLIGSGSTVMDVCAGN